jgi:hypothetical protein
MPAKKRESSAGKQLDPHSELLEIKELTSEAMGRELVFKIFQRKFDQFKNLLEKGANPNFCDTNSGNTLLHFLYFYDQCDTQYLELLLNYGAKVSVNKENLSPYAVAEKRCSATQLQTIKTFFKRFSTAHLNATISKPKETELIPYEQTKLAITIGIPISALASGIIAGGYNEMAERYKHSYSSPIISYGLKPVTLAVGSAVMNSFLAGPADSIGIEDAWLSFAYYLLVNYLGLLFAQFGEKLTRRIQNKALNSIASILLYTFLINPSLLVELTSAGLNSNAFFHFILPLINMLANGLLFKIGEYGTQKVIGKFFTKNSTQDTTSRTYMSYLQSEINEDFDKDLIRVNESDDVTFGQRFGIALNNTFTGTSNGCERNNMGNT